MKSSMQPGQYNILSNEMMAKGELQGDTLNISASSAFVKGQLEQPQALDCIKTAAQKISGRAVTVKIIENKPVSAGSSEKLDGLSRFGNVKFE